jgi:outer membrane murein-binding lipoprotein Lpp
MNTPQKSVSELIAELESLGVTKDEIGAHLQAADAERAREMVTPVGDPMSEISNKLDKLQASVDALAEKLGRE